MVAKDRKNTKGSPKVEVGEIDTRAPFQSVKDAVNLFGKKGAFSGEKPSVRKSNPHSAERVLAKDSQLHVAQKELGKLKDRLKSAEITKAEALVELERAKRTLKDLNEAKETSIRVTEAAKNQERKLDEVTGRDASWKKDLESAREQYSAAITELDNAKKELRKLRLDCDANREEKVAAFKQVTEAENSAKASMERAGELFKEITSVQESIGEVKVATMRAQSEREMIYTEKDGKKQSHKAALEETMKKLNSLKKDINPELTADLKSQLADTMSEIEKLRKDMESTRVSDLDSVKTVTLELDGAKESLHKVAEAESLLKSLLESLKMELEKVKKEHSELKEKETETEAIAGNLHVKLHKIKSEYEIAFLEEAKVRGACEDMIANLQNLYAENENAKNQSEEMKKQAEELKMEAEVTRIALKEVEKTLEIALEEAEEAKAAEVKALDEIKKLSEQTNASRSSTSESGAHITISREEFESLSRKVEESEKLAEMKVGAAMAQVEAVKASENEAVKKLASTQKEVDDIKSATEAALKRAELAEAAKKAIEGELRKWREREQKKEAETAARILSESGAAISTGTSPAGNYRNQVPLPERVVDMRKLEKAKSSVTPKKVLLANFSGIFQRKRSQVDGGASPSYLPGERPL